MPKRKTQDIQPSLYFYFLNFMASKQGLSLLIATNILPYFFILSVSGIMEEDATKLLKPIGIMLSLTFLLEISKISASYNKNFFSTLEFSLILAILITKSALDNAIKPAFLINDFFKGKVKDIRFESKTQLSLNK